jgi:diketogulonate reductase-like aldo/keto reductase
VGAGLAASGVPRSRVFITTKVRPNRVADGDLQRSVDESLSKLGVSEIDLLLLH